MDLNTKNMFYSKKNMFKPCFKQKTCLFILFIGLKKTWLCPVIFTNIFSGFKHVYSCLLFSRGGQL
jgi:hypothetical protein